MFLVFSCVFEVVHEFSLVFASISLAKNKKIQTLAKIYVFLIQKSRCMFQRVVPIFWIVLSSESSGKATAETTKKKAIKTTTRTTKTKKKQNKKQNKKSKNHCLGRSLFNTPNILNKKHVNFGQGLDFLRFWARFWDTRRSQVAIYTVFHEESESEVEKCKKLEPGGKKHEKPTLGSRV